MSKNLATVEDNAVATRQATPMDMLASAMERGIDVEQLKMLQQMHRDHEANEARKAFVEAMTRFRSEPILIEKKKQVRFTTSKGTTEYKHATLAQVVSAALPHMSKYGLSHRWETVQADGRITVTCILMHELGHSERTTLSASPDDSGGKNSIQAVGSTVSYLERYTFLAATGLAASDMDDDGGAGNRKVETISEKQVADLECLIDEIGADKAAFLKVCKVDDLADLPANQFKGAIDRLEQRRKAG